MLKQMLSPDVVDGDECYEFTWVGKKASIVEANKPIRKTLRPCPEESKDWDTTENLYIEGDNLEVLKLLQEAYLGKVKMIYIDPPYNTGYDFIYADDFMRSQREENEQMGMYDEDENRLFKNTDTNGRFHSDWCSMMYSRLMLARNLLADDGVILINMDENEITNLQNLCAEVFGLSNDLGTIVWDKRNPKGDAKGISYQHEFILVYAKNKVILTEKCKIQRPKKNANAILKKAAQLFAKVSESYTLEEANIDFATWMRTQNDFSGGEKAYNQIDENGRVFQAVSMSWPNKKKAPDDYFVPLIHPVTHKPCPVPERGWRNPSATMKELEKKGLIVFGKDENTQPRRKYFLEENLYENIPSLLYYGGSDTELLSQMGIPFETPKVVSICAEHIQSFTEDGDIILDFFSGSATTAHAVMQLNAEERQSLERSIENLDKSDPDYHSKFQALSSQLSQTGKRKFIMVQLPEPCDEKSEAYKAGYKNICEIGKERIRRAGAQILERSLESLERDGMIEKIDKSKLPVLSSKNSPVENLEKEGVIEKLSTSQLSAPSSKNSPAESFEKEGLIEKVSKSKISALSSKNSLGKEGVIEKYAGELSEMRSLEEVYGSGGARVSSHQAAAAGGDLRTGRPNASGGSFHSVEYSGGTFAGNAGVYPVFESGKGITGGVGNTVIALRSLALLNELGYRVCLERFRGDQQNACGTDQTSELQTLNSKLQALNSKLSLDTGFRVLKLDDSNMKDVYYAADDYDQRSLMDMISNIKEDRTDLDLLFGCLLDWGLPLSLPYRSETIDGCTVHTYNDGDLIACFDKNIPENVVKEIAKRKPLRAVFRDSSFADSPSKINVFEIFKLCMPEDANDISKRVRVI